jgi:hypothetical protein
MDGDFKNAKGVVSLAGQGLAQGESSSNSIQVAKHSVANTERDTMFARLQEIILDGLRHGFFDCSITCELVKGGNRRVVVKAGKSHQFTIKEEELQN